MNLYELQERANKLVALVNEFESNIPDEERDENELIAQHKFADIYCLRAVMQYILGNDETRQNNQTLNNQITSDYLGYVASVFGVDGGRYDFSSGIRKYNFLKYSWTNYTFTKNCSDLIPCNFLYADKYNLAIPSVQQHSKQARIFGYSDYNIGLKNMTSPITQDALITEAQVTNLVNINNNIPSKNNEEVLGSLTSKVLNNTIRFFNYTTQPGGIYHIFSTNESYYPFPTVHLFGISEINSAGPISGNKSIEEAQRYNIKTHGTSFAQQLSYYVTSNTRYRYTYASKVYYYQAEPYIIYYYENNEPYYSVPNKPGCCYFELVFKRRREGCKENNLDFVPAVDTSFDNDPQGLATRLALAQCKPYYYKRPWFNELNVYYTDNGEIQTKLADLIEEESKEMDDITFIKTYKLNYETYAKATGDPL